MLNNGLFLNINNSLVSSGGVSNEQLLLNAFVSRVEADGGSVENTACLLSDLTFLMNNP